jgi:uncharacterized protein (TIGR02145 family)
MKIILKILGTIILIIGFQATLISCKKKPTPPAVTTAVVSSITQVSAVSGGNVTDDGGAEVTARGVCWGTSQNPTTSSSKTSDGTGTGTFSSSITGLTAGTSYFVRAYATNSEGTSYGNEVSFTTSPVALATLTTSAVTSITTSTAVSGGNITSDGGGTITARGVCWSKTQNPTTSDSKTTDGSGTGIFTSNLTGLTANTTYHVRAYAVNSAGTAYGDDKEFKTDQIKDADGNSYTCVTIGTQTWLVENLKTTKFNNGNSIPLVTENDTWLALITPAYCNYDNDSNNSTVYGRLYNWYAVIDSRGICPVSWHVPSMSEWTTLIDFLGGVGVAGSKLKETGTTHWASPNADATNESGFTALPGGSRGAGFSDIRLHGLWWSSTNLEYSDTWAYYIGLFNNNGQVHSSYSSPGSYGMSVRCVKD